MKRSIAFGIWNSGNLSHDSLTNSDLDSEEISRKREKKRKKKPSRRKANGTFVARTDWLARR